MGRIRQETPRDIPRSQWGEERHVRPMSLDPKRWREVEQVYHAVLERPEVERRRFLSRACRGDDELLAEVESLLRFDGRGEKLLGEGLASIARRRSRVLSPGDRLGAYEIQDLLGAGGMGEVYRARDGRLDRVVALKVLPIDLMRSSERKERFEREARAISRLNHPHVCTLFHIGRDGDTDFLVMEYLEGETLAERLKRGPLPLEEALEVCVQIADALHAAHRLGVVHRDLKPGNVMLTRAGAKLLDFSLAKLVAPVGAVESGAGQPSDGSPEVGPATRPGMLLGTLHYMAPEQLEGKPVDARTDVFAFGCLLFEMLTGARAFEGETQASVIAAVLRGEPPRLVHKLQRRLPPSLQGAVDRCMAKDPDRRWQAIADVGMLLGDMLDGREDHPSEGTTARGGRPGIRRVLAGLVALVLMSLAWLGGLRLAPQPEPARAEEGHFVLEAPEFGVFQTLNNPSLSPDGRRVAFIGQTSEGYGIWIRDLDELTAHRVEGPENPGWVTFSPDGEWLAYFEVVERKILKVSVHGGGPVVLADPGYVPFHWASDGCVYYPPRKFVAGLDPASAGLARWCHDAVEPEQVTWAEDVDAFGVRQLHAAPQLLPNGKLLFSVGSGYLDEGWDAVVLDLDTGEWKRVLEEVNQATYFEGHLVFWRDERIWAVPLDLDRLQTRGVAQPVLASVAQHPAAPIEVGHFQLSAHGSLVYVNSGPSGEEAGTLVRLDPDRLREVARVPGRLHSPRVSPDGSHVAAERCLPDASPDGADCRLWIYDIATDTWSALSPSGLRLGEPAWERDGETLLAQMRTADGRFHLVRLGATPGEPPRVLFTSPDRSILPLGTAVDGRLYFTLRRPSGGGDLWFLSPDGRAEALIDDDFDNWATDLSSDGRWLLFESDRSGRYEIYSLELGAPGSAPVRLSAEGGRFAALAPSQDVIYWRSTSYPDTAAVLTAVIDLGAGRIGEVTVMANTRRVSYSAWEKVGGLSPDRAGVWAAKVKRPPWNGRVILVRNFEEKIRRALAPD